MELGPRALGNRSIVCDPRGSRNQCSLVVKADQDPLAKAPLQRRL
jgi:predicted NodU family carbamoyl transferase